MLEGLDPLHHRSAAAGVEQSLVSADRPKGLAIKFEATLSHPLEDEIVVQEGAFVGANATQSHEPKEDIELVAEIIQGISCLTEG